MYSIYHIPLCLFLGKPYISDSKTIIDVPVGGNVSLNVSFYSNDGSEPVIKWVTVMNNSELEVSKSQEEGYHISTFADDVLVSYYGTDVMEPGNTTRLTIDNVKAEDFKSYIVKIENTIGTMNHTVVLAARGESTCVKFVHALFVVICITSVVPMS